MRRGTCARVTPATESSHNQRLPRVRGRSCGASIPTACLKYIHRNSFVANSYPTPLGPGHRSHQHYGAHGPPACTWACKHTCQIFMPRRHPPKTTICSLALLGPAPGDSREGPSGLPHKQRLDIVVDHVQILIQHHVAWDVICVGMCGWVWVWVCACVGG